jgi:hypothetical protein
MKGFELIVAVGCVRVRAYATEQHVKVEPTLKAWLDNVFVPVMVRQYLAVTREVADNGLSAAPPEKSIPSTPEKVQ